MYSQAFAQDDDGEVLRFTFPDVPESERPYSKVSYGMPFEKACRKHVDGFLGVQRVYILASRSIASQTVNLTKLEAALSKKHVGTWTGIPSHTPYDSLIPIMNDIRDKQADCIVTLGGGSLADGAKVMVYALENGVESTEDLIRTEKSFIEMGPEQLHGIGNPAKIPMVFTPTTLSGAEYSTIAGTTNPRSHLKVQFTHPSMYASLLILDPELCRTTPDGVWRSSGVRAIDHCVESMCSPYARAEIDEAGKRGLVRLITSLLAYARNPADTEARLKSQLGCNDAMTCIVMRAWVGASHGIGHMLGPLGVNHGHTSCVLLPAVCKYNARVNQSKQDHVKKILWDQPEIAAVLALRGLQEESSDLGDGIRAVFNELGMPKSLKEVGVKREDWDMVARNSLNAYFCGYNPVPLTEVSQVKEILEMCSGD